MEHTFTRHSMVPQLPYKLIEYSLSFATVNEVVEDTTPQLGGDLDVNGNSITSNI